MHPCDVRPEREVVAFPTERVEARAHFETFVEDENERPYKALCFVTGSQKHPYPPIRNGAASNEQHER
jgi:hypothetical protein